MFKNEGKVWLYLIGVIIMFGILFTIGRDIIIPVIYGRKKIDFPENDYSNPPAFEINIEEDYLARLDTNFGEVIIDLYEDSAPLNVNNIVFLSNNGYYTRTKFHRLVPNFLIQGGDRKTLDIDTENDGQGNPGYFIKDEVNWDSLDLSEDTREDLENKGFASTPGVESQHLERFSVAMANTGEPNTNGSQFFIVFASFDDPRLQQLDGYFTVIGKVVAGGEVIDKLANIEVTNPDSAKPIPTQDILIENLEVYTR